jgi:hypothetical protein
MGLSAFNRMRREKAPVERMEAERFRADNEMRQRHRNESDGAYADRGEAQDAARAAEKDAVARIGEKMAEAMRLPPVDDPLRRDHEAEIVGRNLQDVDQPKDPVQRIDERIPSGDGAAAALLPRTSVEREGPTVGHFAAAAAELGGSASGILENGTNLNVAPRAAATQENAVAPAGETHSTGVTSTNASTDVDADNSGATPIESRDPAAGDNDAVDSDAGGGEEDADADAGAETIDIPEDWEAQPAEARKALASQLAGYEVTRVSDGDPIIREEVSRRASDEEGA